MSRARRTAAFRADLNDDQRVVALIYLRWVRGGV
jgi:hypothetical protein